MRVNLGFALAALVAGSLIGALAPGGAAALPASCDLKAASAVKAGAGCARAWFDVNLRINEIQTVGTAESYKQLPSPLLMLLVKMGSAKDAKALDFAEPPIARQLDTNARSLEFDIAYDPKGGLFKNPAGAILASQLLSDAYLATMSAPGFKVVHIIDIDFNSICLTLVSCLKDVAVWSRAHPSHVPIVISLRSNDERTPMPRATTPIPFDAAAFDALDTEIRSVFKPDEIISPDSVQGKFATLHDATAAHNWPLLGSSRGKVIFLLDDTAQKVAMYRGKRHSLEGRVMFVSTDEKSPLAAFVTIEDPIKDAARITADVKAGLMVHTWADAETKEARTDNTARRESALTSGAQIVSTDFLYADPKIGPYQVRLANDHRASCDVQLSPQRCGGLGVERGNLTSVAAVNGTIK